jgi:hypothetical protein
MAAVTRQYEKLPGRTSYFAGVAKLWAHQDYLLAVTTYFGVENYRRYFYRDIQALMIRRTRARFWWNLGFGVCAVLLGCGALGFWLASRRPEANLANFSIGSAIALSVLAGLFVFALIWNSVRGATCVLVAQMATGPQSLPGVTRVRPARKILAQVAPRIVEAQSGTPVFQIPTI